MFIESPVKEFRIPEQCNCIPKVLIVDDIFYNLMPLKIMIQSKFGLEVDMAENGLIAKNKFIDAAKKDC